MSKVRQVSAETEIGPAPWFPLVGHAHMRRARDTAGDWETEGQTAVPGAGSTSAPPGDIRRPCAGRP